MASKPKKVKWAKGFKVPTNEDSLIAIGEFPFHFADKTRSDHQPSNQITCLDDLNNKSLYDAQLSISKNKGKSSLWEPISAPMDENDWLAQIPEEGQTFDDFISEITMRSGRFKSSHFGGKKNDNQRDEYIALVPIIRCDSSAPVWPDHGPDLEKLRAFCSIYFNRGVKIMSPATVSLVTECSSKPGACFKNKLSWHHNATGRRTITQIRVATEKAGCSPSSPSNNPSDKTFDKRIQILVDPLLCELASMRDTPEYKDCFCVMGITMEDLYSCASDLFVAGMAAGGSNAAVFSFHRYHPRLKMSPEHWYDFGYVKQVSNYSYFEDAPKRRPITTQRPCDDGQLSLKVREASSCELLRRSAKLMVHELMHIFGIDHCIHYKCIMNGTGHLVEDFAAPMHLCPIDLRKMQWRMAFDLIGRERQLLRYYEEEGWLSEAKWTKKRLGSLDGVKLENRTIDAEVVEVEVVDIEDDEVEVIEVKRTKRQRSSKQSN